MCSQYLTVSERQVKIRESQDVKSILESQNVLENLGTCSQYSRVSERLVNIRVSERLVNIGESPNV